MIDDHASHQRMIVLRAALAHRQYVMSRPPLGEFRTDGVQPVHKLDKMRVAGTTAVIGAEPGESVLGTLAPIDHQGAQRRVGEDRGDLLEGLGQAPRPARGLMQEADAAVGGRA